jgi:23S rRNA (uracil1939-C5)-methyltransferase
LLFHFVKHLEDRPFGTVKFLRDFLDADRKVVSANENAKANKINNAKFYQGDSGELLLKLLNDGEYFDVIVVDPPRTGLDSKFIDAIIKSNAKRVIYVSCNPATLAKNIDKLSDKYQVKQIIPLDLFPFTSHCESITLLTLKN